MSFFIKMTLQLYLKAGIATKDQLRPFILTGRRGVSVQSFYHSQRSRWRGVKITGR